MMETQYRDDKKKEPGKAEYSNYSPSNANNQGAGFEIPQISLPKAGSMKGMEEKFSANPVTGSATLSIPFPIAKTRNDFSPQLGVGYDSSAGNGIFGLGWRFSLPAIRRKTEKGIPRYDDESESDVFVLSQSEDLVPVTNGAGKIIDIPFTEAGVNYAIRRYRPRQEGIFARIERWKDTATGNAHWRATSADNTTSIYGRQSSARVVDPEFNYNVFEWLPEITFDDKGNCVRFFYKKEDFVNVQQAPHEQHRLSGLAKCTNVYLKKIAYGNRMPYHPGDAYLPENDFLFETVLDFGEHDLIDPQPNDANNWAAREDAFSNCRSGFELRTYRLCKRIMLFHKFESLGYNHATNTNACLVSDVKFTYDSSISGLTFLKAVQHTGYLRKIDGTYDARSLPPLEFTYQPHAWDREVHNVAFSDLTNSPIGLSGSYQWTDLYGEALPGILTEEESGMFYKRNLGGGHFAPAQSISPKPSLSGKRSVSIVLQELEGDGRQYLVSYSTPQGFFAMGDKSDWKPFRPFKQAANIPWSSPATKFIDIDGDGRPDMIVDNDQVFSCYLTEGEDGYAKPFPAPKPATEEKGARLIFSDKEQKIFLADMTGDGLTDLVRIRNADICYWQNRGYGQFGPMVVMSNAPRLAPTLQDFNPQYVFLADLDGSGTTDLVYMGDGNFCCWLNLDGNRWSNERFNFFNPFPAIDNYSRIAMVDLLGNGTACVVWSSPLPAYNNAPMRYVDLLKGHKPHLLTGYKNNCGREMKLEYSPSTQFYLAAASAGKPWVTHLPFVVHCLSKSSTIDAVSQTRFTCSYEYHHGYYDKPEREFRGFGKVVSTDSELYKDFVIGTTGGGAITTDHEFYQPPVTTITWFHTGIFVLQEELLDTYQHEYFQQKRYIAPAILPATTDVNDLIDCCRALKGMVLHQEVYSYDGSPNQDIPFSIVESCYELRLLQPRRDQRSSIVDAFGCESITVDLEREPADPRISHQFVLERDEYGNITQSASVVYGRHAADMSLPARVRTQQGRTYITFTQAAYTNDIISPAPSTPYRLREVFESSLFEITGVAPASGTLYKKSDLTGLQLLPEITYETIANTATPQRRLLGKKRIYYRRNDLSGPLPLGSQNSLGLVFQTFSLAFTPAQITAWYGGAIVPADLSAGGYQSTEMDGNWWVPSSIYLYSPGAANHFYLASGVRDALGMTTTTAYDAFDLLALSSTDQLGNTTTATPDYRTLAPVMISDANSNRTAVETDALGMVIKMAIMGKLGAGEGDTLADPTMRFEYDLDNWRINSKPNFAHIFCREKHGAPNPRWQESYAYYNGGGGIAMTKTQASPGIAKHRQPNGTVVDIDTTPALRWVGNGKSVLNNKGNIVKQYEPFYSTSFEYEMEDALGGVGITPVLYYDAPGRNIKSLYPDTTFSTVEFTSWMSKAFDRNDNVKLSQWYADRGSPDPAVILSDPADPQERAAWLAAKHANTPGIVHTDTLGRVVYGIIDNAAAGKYSTYSETDLTGRFFKVEDTRSREMASGIKSMLGIPVSSTTAEQGLNHIFPDALGKPVRSWDTAGNTFITTFDGLHRPVNTWYQQGANPPSLILHSVYGEMHPNAIPFNMRGRCIMFFDQGGASYTSSFDFKGIPISAEQRIVQNYSAALINWSALDGLTDPNVIRATAEAQLEPESFVSSATLDALGRPELVKLPDNTELHPVFDEANTMESLSVKIKGVGGLVPFLIKQEYDAKGQRQMAQYGNNSVTRYTYEPLSNRLSRLFTRRGADNALLQDLSYIFDPEANITAWADNAQQDIFFNNAVVSPSATFEYDAVYRLIKATGREQAAGNATVRDNNDIPFNNLPFTNGPTAVRNYTELYDYDDLGNITRMRHIAGGGSWTRNYRYAYELNATDKTNRLLDHKNTSDPFDALTPYGYDVHGNMVRMPHLAALSWNFMDQLKSVDLGGGGVAWYSYAAAGGRCRKVIERGGGLKTERIYLGPFEIYREWSGATKTLERQTLHISDNNGRFAQVDTKTAGGGPDLNTPLIRYYFGNHLASATLVTDANAQIVSYEEFHPFGTAAYRSGANDAEVSLKRYRFTGKEHDSETSFYYFGARYYVPWLGRWINPDPGGFVDGFNLYRYCSNNPVILRDRDGMQERHTHSYGVPRRFRNEDEVRAYWENRIVNWEGQRQRVHVTGVAPGPNGRWRVSFEGTPVDASGNPLPRPPSNSTAGAPGGVNGGTGNSALPPSNGTAATGPTGNNPAGGSPTGSPGGSPQGNPAGGGPGGTLGGSPTGTPGGITGGAPPERSFWDRGGTNLVFGSIALGLGILLLLSNPVGWFAMLSAAMLLAGGIAATTVSGIQLANSYAGNSTAEQDRQVSDAVSTTLSLSSPGGLVGGVGGGLYWGGEEGVRRGAFWGGMAEAGGSLAYGGGRALLKEVEFGIPARPAWDSVRPAIQDIYGYGNAASRVRPNPAFASGAEQLQLSHWIPQRWFRNTWGEWVFNRPWNVTPLWHTEHALVDWYIASNGQIRGAYQFLPRVLKPQIQPLLYQGVQRQLLLAPPWLLQSGYGIGRGGLAIGTSSSDQQEQQ